MDFGTFYQWHRRKTKSPYGTNTYVHRLPRFRFFSDTCFQFKRLSTLHQDLYESKSNCVVLENFIPTTRLARKYYFCRPISHFLCVGGAGRFYFWQHDWSRYHSGNTCGFQVDRRGHVRKSGWDADLGHASRCDSPCCRGCEWSYFVSIFKTARELRGHQPGHINRRRPDSVDPGLWKRRQRHACVS